MRSRRKEREKKERKREKAREKKRKRENVKKKKKIWPLKNSKHLYTKDLNIKRQTGKIFAINIVTVNTLTLQRSIQTKQILSQTAKSINIRTYRNDMNLQKESKLLTNI